MHFAWYGPNTAEKAFGYRVIGDGFVIEMGSVDPAAQHLHTIYHDLGNVLGTHGLTSIRLSACGAGAALEPVRSPLRIVRLAAAPDSAGVPAFRQTRERKRRAGFFYARASLRAPAPS